MSDEQRKSEGHRTGITIRLDDAMHQRVTAQSEALDRSLADIGRDLFKGWVESYSDKARKAKEAHQSLQKILISAVTEHLRTNRQWADAILRASSLIDPVVSTYLLRIHHFYDEKRFLSKSFGPWLIRRIFHHLDQGADVCLVVESGTTLKTIMDDLPSHLVNETKKLGRKLPADRLSVVTNNFPGAESYEANASAINDEGKKVIEEGGPPLSEIVPCHMVPGRALQEYAAVVGEKAESHLKEQCLRTGKKQRPLVCVGLIVGNWVMLEGDRPTPLARGAGHKSFKEVLLDHCHEVYLITPLGKLIAALDKISTRQNLAEFNKDLLGQEPGPKGKYERVDRPKSDVQGRLSTQSRVKVVTTERRNPKSVLARHSMRIMNNLRSASAIGMDQAVGASIEAIDHFIYRYDEFSNLTEPDQIEIELPHEDTQTEDFRVRWFQFDR